MKRISLFSCLLLNLALYAQNVQYKVSFANAVHHEAVIELTVKDIPLKPAVFKMSRSSPGRYATHEFGKNVYNVSAVDLSGKILPVTRVDGDIYEVAEHNGAITLKYTLFGNYADGTYASIDPESIHLNMPAAFMWMKGLDNAPITITFQLPAENKGVIATQLIQTDQPNTFRAPGLQYFMDSPTKIGDLKFRQWPITNPDGKNFTMRIALESGATDAQADELAEKIKKIVAEARAVYGEFPNYDNGTYTFIASATPWVQGDGMEHRNSTMITVPMADFNSNNLLDVFSHEYFHNWNVERIRPKTLEPFNFEKSNMSHELWFAEGFTQYYGELILARAGLSPEKNHLNFLSSLINTKLNTPGGMFYSPVEASNHAVFVDAAVSIDKNNYNNMYSSYYPYGAAIALALDLELQTRFHKRLDIFMQAMWKKFGKNETPYTLATMQETLAEISSPSFARDFFTSYISGHAMIDYSALLSNAGYELKKTYENKAAVGINTRTNESGKLVIAANTLKRTAAYEAGLDINDEIIQLDDMVVKNSSELATYLAGKHVGDGIMVTFKHRNTEKTVRLTVKEQPSVNLQSIEQNGKSITASMKGIRDSWFTTSIK